MPITPMWKIHLIPLFLFVNFISFSSTAIAETHNLSLPISPEDVYSIIVIPNKAQGASRYRLQIYSNQEQKIPIVDITHPLRGQISNVEILDIDKDGDEELIIESTKKSGTSKVHEDIFELRGSGFLGKVKALLQF